MTSRRSAARLTVAALMMLAGPVGVVPALGEKYLTPEQALHVCFPAADRTEGRLVRFTTEQAKALRAALGRAPANNGHRYWVAWQGTNILGVLVIDHVVGKHELIDYAVAIGAAGLVQQVEILEYRESHGAQIRGVKWRDQFKGRTSRDTLRLHDEIYNISGATMSCRSVTDGVRRVLLTYDQVIRPGLAVAGARASGGVPDGRATAR